MGDIERVEDDPNAAFEDDVKKTLFDTAAGLDKYTVAVLLLNNLVKQLEPERQMELLNSLLTEYFDKEDVEGIEYLPSYFKACEVYLDFYSPIAGGLKANRDAARVPFERKREAAMIEILREGQPKQDESSMFRRVLGMKDEE